jgi:hypothetical protein
MLKTSTIAACVLALSGAVAMAQTYSQAPGQPGWIPPGPGNPPAGAGGPASARDIGSPSANVNQAVGGQTQSTTILSQSNKAQSAAGMPSANYGQPYYGAQAQMAGAQGDCGNPRSVAITDEYGNKYNCRGDRIGRGRAMRAQNQY